ncbi:hypothetical protein FOZ62_002257, partial [Perkinsus olseni]
MPSPPRRQRPKSRGDPSTALKLVQNRRSLEKAISTFRGLTFASSTKSTMLARLRLWKRLSIGLGIEFTPLSANGVESIMAVLRCAGYRSAGCYLSAIISYNRDQGHVMDSATEAAVRRARLACKRNLGPPTRMRGISLAELRLLASKLTGFYAKQRVAGYLMASWFLLRCSEALSMDMQHIRFDEGSKTV